MNATVTITLPEGIRSRLADTAKKTGFSDGDLVKAFISSGLDQMDGDGVVIRAPLAGQDRLKPTPAHLRRSEPPHVPLDIGAILTGAESLQLDALALRHGVPPEALAAAYVRRLLKRSTAPQRTFRLNMPEHAKRKLEEHAQALGCRAAELAAFLFTKRAVLS